MMIVQIRAIAVAVMLDVVSAQTFPSNICSGGASDYAGTTACNTLLSGYSTIAPAVWSEQTCKQTIPSLGIPWSSILTYAQGHGCCTSYISACAKYTAPPNECKGGQADFLPSAIGSGTTSCGIWQYNFEIQLLANTKATLPLNSGTWTADTCAQTADGTSTGSTIASVMTYSFLPNCCKSGKTACDASTPAAAPATAPAAASASCFSGEDTVQIASGASKLFFELKVGDKVLTANSIGELSFADVVFLPHAKNNDVANFVELTTKSGKKIKATQMHLLQACSGKLDYAKNLKIGDCLRTVDGDDQISSVSNTKTTGLYTAVTTNEFLVVNGVIASPFAVAHTPTHAFYNIHRALYAVAPGLLQQKSLVSANALLGTSAAFAYSLFTSSAN